MIGIVLVSHSKKLAESVVELILAMRGDGLKIEAAGGFGKNRNSFGTDANIILDSIEQVYSEDGVLVLMDLGSAILSAELAVEMLDPDKAEKVYLCDAPFVEGAIVAAVQAGIGTPIELIQKEARNGLVAKQIQLGTCGSEMIDNKIRRNKIKDDLKYSTKSKIINPMGLHARPAARFVETAGKFPKTEIFIENLTAKKGPENAKSIIGVTSLGILQGHEILITAVGEEAQLALNVLQALLKNNSNTNSKSTLRN